MLIAAAANNIQQAATPPKTASPIGILQRFEIQLSLVDDNNRDVLQQHDSCCSTSQQLEIIADPSDAENMVRCPCCRASQVKLICVSCLCTNVLRIGKVKEELRRLQQSKTAVSFLIESALLDEIKFESDFHQLRRSIDGLKAKIAWKRDQVGRLRQRIANMNCDSERSHRNLVLLEKKTISHIDRINKTQLKIEDVKTVFCSLASKLSERITLVSRAFFQIFQLEKRQLFTGEHPPIAWTGQPKVHRAAYLLNNCLCLDRTSLLDKIFTQQIGAAAVSTSSDASTELAQQQKQQYHQTFVQQHQQSPYESMAALAFAGQLAEQLAILLDFHLPYGRHLRKGLPLLFLCCPPVAGGGGSLPPPEMALRQALFRLDYAILHLCLGQGVRPEQCAFTEPLANLHELIMLIQTGKMSTCVPRIDQRLHRQICEQFTKMQPDGRVLSEFTLDNVENDWVKVHCSS